MPDDHPTFLDTAPLRARRLGAQGLLGDLDTALAVVRTHQALLPTLLDGLDAAWAPEAWSGQAADAARAAFTDEATRLAQAAADLDDAVATAEARQLALADEVAGLDAEIAAAELAATEPAA